MEEYSVKSSSSQLEQAEETEAGAENGYPMYFGVSCAFLALHLVSSTRAPDLNQCRRSQLSELILRGSAQLLGLLVAKAQRRESHFRLQEQLKRSEMEADQLRRRRTEDAKANEKVAKIFAAHEQSWISERKSLRRQLQALLNEMRSLKHTHEEAISDLKRLLEEEERGIGFKVEALEQEMERCRELQEKVKLAEQASIELKERAMKDEQDYAVEIWKHKTALVDLVSNQRRLEAELARAARQADVAKRELEDVFRQKEEAVAMAEELSGEIARLKKDTEQKDKVLTAMLRKSKIDTADKQVLLKEVKMNKARKKQAELETERWRNMWESQRYGATRSSRGKGKGIGMGKAASRDGCSMEATAKGFERKRQHLADYFEAESRKDHDFPFDFARETVEEDHDSVTCIHPYPIPSPVNDTPATAPDELQDLQEWIRREAEKYVSIMDEQHNAEIEAFTEQMRAKDEKQESLRWRLLSTDLEKRRVQSHIDGLNRNLQHCRDENIRLESLLLDRVQELKAVKDQFALHVFHCQRNNSIRSTNTEGQGVGQAQEQQKCTFACRDIQNPEQEETKVIALETVQSGENTNSHDEACPTEVSVQSEPFEDQSPTLTNETAKEVTTVELNASTEDQTRASHSEEIEEVKEVGMDPAAANSHIISPKVEEIGFGSTTLTRKDSNRKSDIHALGISYKIKRLKQQLLVLEKLAGPRASQKPLMKEDDSGDTGTNEGLSRQNQRSYVSVLSLLNKQVKRYQSLEEKIDDLCSRMEESYRSERRKETEENGRTKEERERLEQFLEETFQLQRYMVATGQKLLEIQTKIRSCFSVSSADGVVDKSMSMSMGFNMNMGQFAEIIRTLFRDIQRGLEVRIARVIGDLEGTLASHGILHT